MLGDSAAGSGYVCCLYAMMWDLDQEMMCHERVGSWMVVKT